MINLDRTKCCVVLLILFLGVACTSNMPQKKEIKKKRPNILFIAVDDLRPELNFYGANHIKSSNLDQLNSKSTINRIKRKMGKRFFS